MVSVQQGKLRKKAGNNNSPTPWVYDQNTNTIISKPTGKVVFELNTDPIDSEDVANAFLVVSAVNAVSGHATKKSLSA